MVPPWTGTGELASWHPQYGGWRGRSGSLYHPTEISGEILRAQESWWVWFQKWHFFSSLRYFISSFSSIFYWFITINKSTSSLHCLNFSSLKYFNYILNSKWILQEPHVTSTHLLRSCFSTIISVKCSTSTVLPGENRYIRLHSKDIIGKAGSRAKYQGGAHFPRRVHLVRKLSSHPEIVCRRRKFLKVILFNREKGLFWG